MTTPGLYRHFKGGLYRVLGVATQTETQEPLVVYRGSDGQLWARPQAMFSETVIHGGKTVPRFTFLNKP